MRLSEEIRQKPNLMQTKKKDAPASPMNGAFTMYDPSKSNSNLLARNNATKSKSPLITRVNELWKNDHQERLGETSLPFKFGFNNSVNISKAVQGSFEQPNFPSKQAASGHRIKSPAFFDEKITDANPSGFEVLLHKLQRKCEAIKRGSPIEAYRDVRRENDQLSGSAPHESHISKLLKTLNLPGMNPPDAKPEPRWKAINFSNLEQFIRTKQLDHFDAAFGSIHATYVQSECEESVAFLANEYVLKLKAEIIALKSSLAEYQNPPPEDRPQSKLRTVGPAKGDRANISISGLDSAGDAKEQESRELQRLSNGGFDVQALRKVIDDGTLKARLENLKRRMSYTASIFH